MVEYIKLDHVGPSSHMLLEFAPRLNLLTGDNGLGKTFALDLAWWVLTRTWAGAVARPRGDDQGAPGIEYSVWGKTRKAEPHRSTYDRPTQSWKLAKGRPPASALVIYVRVDGGFSVWDPARNYYKKLVSKDYDQPDRPSAFQFSREDVWAGLKYKETDVCNGLLRDWIIWQYQKTHLFEALTEVLKGLSPCKEETLRPGKPVRSSPVDSKEEPTLVMPYGTIPVTVASAAMRRVLALAYLLVWTWSEHKAASELLQQEPTNRLVFLIDEVEAHLHPQWQRVILPALLDVITKLYETLFDGSLQIIATTHAPLVLASVETRFSPSIDKLINFELQDNKVEVVNEPWAKQGDVLAWLVSDVFGLKEPRSREGERAIEAADAFMRGDRSSLPADLQSREQIHAELLKVLPGNDYFWARWIGSSAEGSK